MLANVGPNAFGSRPSRQRRTQDEIRIQQRDPVKLPILPDRIPPGRFLRDRVHRVPHFSRPLREVGRGRWPIASPGTGTITLFDAFTTVQSPRRKTNPYAPKMRSRFSLHACYRLPYEVVYKQQLPVVRPRSVHRRNPLPVLPMRFETHMDEKRNHTRAEIRVANRKENCLKVCPRKFHNLGSYGKGQASLAYEMHTHTNPDFLPCPVRRVDRRLECHSQRQARAVS
jgi:hypothetical protein